MKNLKAIILLFGLFSSALKLNSQSIPVELMAGNKYGTVNLSFSKSFSQTSKLGFFHMNTVQFDYRNESGNSFLIQDQLYYEMVRNLRITGGVAYSKGGFSPTAGFQYIRGGKNLFFLFAPRVNILEEPSYDFMTIIQYKPFIGKETKLYTRLQMLNLFDSGGNIKSYQWLRLGLELKGLQFGLAADFDELGPSPVVTGNFGVFLRKEIL